MSDHIIIDLVRIALPVILAMLGWWFASEQSRKNFDRSLCKSQLNEILTALNNIRALTVDYYTQPNKNHHHLMEEIELFSLLIRHYGYISQQKPNCNNEWIAYKDAATNNLPDKTTLHELDAELIINIGITYKKLYSRILLLSESKIKEI